MLIKSSKNRSEIKKYLEDVSEDDLINDVIVPFYSSLGYSVLRIVTHGPGEHGKDLIVYRYSSAIFGNEYIAIQAKAQKVDVRNITDMANQLIRALRTPIKDISGIGEFLPNYVIHFNSKTVTNDAHWEFPYLVDGKDNIKIISQDNVVDLMLNNDIVPEKIAGNLEKANELQDDLNRNIQLTLYSGSSMHIDAMFENVIPISKANINDDTQHMLVEYIFKRWHDDKSWAGTVKPMKWLDDCFEFMSVEQYKYLMEVIDEYTATYPSHDAAASVYRIVNKIKLEHYKEIKDYFIETSIREFRFDKKTDLMRLLLGYISSEDESEITEREKNTKLIVEKINTMKQKWPINDESDRREWQSLWYQLDELGGIQR